LATELPRNAKLGAELRFGLDKDDNIGGDVGSSCRPSSGELLPAFLEDYVDADNPVRIIDAFVDELDLYELGFAGAAGIDPQTQLRAGHDPQAL
jgi:hypothetical protein